MSRLFPKAPPRKPRPIIFVWKNPHGDYWRTERIAGRFEGMVVRGRDGGHHSNVFSYVVFDYGNKECICRVISKSKGKSIESAKFDAEREIKIRMAGLL